MDRFVRTIVGWIAWPGLLAGCVLATQFGFALGQPQIAFALTYLLLGAALFLLQRWMPHSPGWQEKDGQLGPDLAHSVASAAAVQGMVAFTTMVGVAAGLTLFTGHGFDVWPRGLPLAVQVILGMAVLEFALYWAHRLAHEWRPLWYFHAVHHSVPRLSFVNNGRFHFVDGVKSALPGLLLLMALGAPLEMLIWQSALGGYIGMLTHSNVAMRFGWLSFIFNTPELHRWHHSKDPREGNRNYGESLMLWDQIFGSFFRQNRCPPEEIGVVEPMPDRFAAQILWPFRMLASPRAIAEEAPSAPRG
jgi:sterol desaturase/sphingolipid hydroxylase (fatty acid hydroxylase superfamily)